MPNIDKVRFEGRNDEALALNFAPPEEQTYRLRIRLHAATAFAVAEGGRS